MTEKQKSNQYTRLNRGAARRKVFLTPASK
jgi:hypothetical protein